MPKPNRHDGSSRRYAMAGLAACAVGAFLIFAGPLTPVATAQSSDLSATDIQAKISENNQKIADLKKEIDQYSNLIDSTSKQAQTLSTALKSLELTQSKLEANLALTQKQISKTGLTLQALDGQIKDAEQAISTTSEALSETMREMSMAESQSAIELFLNNKSLSAAWDYVNAVQTLQNRVEGRLSDLKDLHDLLNAKIDAARGQKVQLERYRKNLSDQQQAVIQNKQSKSQLLADTNGREASYRQILAQKMALEQAYEQELYSYESKLPSDFNAKGYPAAQHGILSWPLDSIHVTQYFGKTVSARRLYVSGTHNGIDLRASIGTPVYAALSGTVTDTEPTKTRSGCQYGKFVLIKHPNGLSTIYGHLSVVSVKPGDPVVTGDVIGYSGETGYAVGPHLHLGLYVTSSIRIVNSADLGSTHCAGIKTVAAPPAGYLDPMAYLPSL